MGEEGFQQDPQINWVCISLPQTQDLKGDMGCGGECGGCQLSQDSPDPSSWPPWYPLATPLCPHPQVLTSKGDAWAKYMAEVKKYKAHQCGDDDKTRPLVK